MKNEQNYNVAILEQFVLNVNTTLCRNYTKYNSPL